MTVHTCSSRTLLLIMKSFFQLSDIPTPSPLPAGLTLSQDTQARLARVPLPHHLANTSTLPHHLTNPGQPVPHHLANATTLPHHLTSASNQLGSNLTTASPHFSSSTSPPRWRISPTRLDPIRSDSSRLDQLTPSPTLATSSPLPAHTSPSRRASDQGGHRSGHGQNPEPDISPSRRTPAPPEHGGGYMENPDLTNSRLAPSSSRWGCCNSICLPKRNYICCPFCCCCWC